MVCLSRPVGDRTLQRSLAAGDAGVFPRCSPSRRCVGAGAGVRQCHRPALLLLYKEEIERSLRTPIYGGFQMLGLQDSFDQGAAYVGTGEQFLRAETVRKGRDVPGILRASGAAGPAAPNACWTSDETLAAEIELANYGPGCAEGSRGYLAVGRARWWSAKGNSARWICRIPGYSALGAFRATRRNRDGRNPPRVGGAGHGNPQPLERVGLPEASRHHGSRRGEGGEHSRRAPTRNCATAPAWCCCRARSTVPIPRP